MRKIILYIATSVDGFIANSEGDVDWLENIPNPKNEDYGYSNFYESIDTTIQGFNTYKQIIDWKIEFPYKGKTNYVLTQKKDIENTKYVSFINNNPIEFIRDLKMQKGIDIWLIGGGTVNSLLLYANLIDEVQQFIMPIVLGDGIKIFKSFPNIKPANIVSSKIYKSGVFRLNYKP